MTQIFEYIMMIVGACLICGGLTILSPSGQFERMIQVIGSLFLLLCMLSPLTETVNGLIGYWEYESQEAVYQLSDAWEYSLQAMSQTLENKINSYVVDVTGQDAEDIQVIIEHNGESFSLDHVQIIVSDDDMAKATAIVDYVALRTGVRPDVISE